MLQNQTSLETLEGNADVHSSSLLDERLVLSYVRQKNTCQTYFLSEPTETTIVAANDFGAFHDN